MGILKYAVPYSGLFSNQKFSHKCLNINFGGFIFEVGIFQVAMQLFQCSYAMIILRHSSSAVKIYNSANRCSRMTISVFPGIAFSRILFTANRAWGQFILALRASNIIILLA